jgi:hypothetical protein
VQVCCVLCHCLSAPFEALLDVISTTLPPPPPWALSPSLTASTAATGHRLTGGEEEGEEEGGAVATDRRGGTGTDDADADVVLVEEEEEEEGVGRRRPALAFPGRTVVLLETRIGWMMGGVMRYMLSPRPLLLAAPLLGPVEVVVEEVGGGGREEA